MLVASTDERLWAWGGLLGFLVSASLIVALIWRKTLTGRIALVSLSASLVIAAAILPSVKHEFIHVTPEAITVDTGNWYNPSRSVTPMTGVVIIRESEPQGILPANLIGDPAINWQITRLNGRNEIMVLNDFFNAHRMVVAYYYKDRGYRLERLEDRLMPVVN